jgi:hypothetical protein
MFGERSLRRAMSEYVEHCRAERNHGKGNVLLCPRSTRIHCNGHVQCCERLGSLLRYYYYYYHQEGAWEGRSLADFDANGLSLLMRRIKARISVLILISRGRRDRRRQ